MVVSTEECGFDITHASGPWHQPDHLRQLGELRASGVLTEEEFAAQKARVLAG